MALTRTDAHQLVDALDVADETYERPASQG
jgi:hypothetical protein